MSFCHGLNTLLINGQSATEKWINEQPFHQNIKTSQIQSKLPLFAIDYLILLILYDISRLIIFHFLDYVFTSVFGDIYHYNFDFGHNFLLYLFFGTLLIRIFNVNR